MGPLCIILCMNRYERELNKLYSKLSVIFNYIHGKYITISKLQQCTKKRQPTKEAEADADRDDRPKSGKDDSRIDISSLLLLISVY